MAQTAYEKWVNKQNADNPKKPLFSVWVAPRNGGATYEILHVGVFPADNDPDPVGPFVLHNGIRADDELEAYKHATELLSLGTPKLYTCHRWYINNGIEWYINRGMERPK